MRRGRYAWPVAAIGALVAAAATAAGTMELRVNVVGLRSGEGEVRFALYDRAHGFPTDDGKIAGARIAARAEGVTATFGPLSAGRYAVAVYHDENGNGRFDQGLFGIPLEDYGFSNDAAAWFGPPSFADAAVAVEDATEITIRLDR